MAELNFDLIVVGCGVAGLSAAGTSLRPCINLGSKPLRPIYCTRNASTAAKSAAARANGKKGGRPRKEP